MERELHRWNSQEEIAKYRSHGGKWVFIYTSARNGQGGVGILFREHFTRIIRNMEAINERILVVTLEGNPKVSVITAYAPHSLYPVQERKEFFEAIYNVISNIPTHNMIIIGGDLNSQIGKQADNTNSEICGPLPSTTSHH